MNKAHITVIGIAALSLGVGAVLLNSGSDSTISPDVGTSTRDLGVPPKAQAT